MSMFGSAGVVLVVMVAAYAGVRFFTKYTEICMLAAALAGAAAGGHFFPVRHVAEGAATYLDINLIFLSATLFMNILSASGGIAFAVRRILARFHRHRAALLVFLALLLLVPGALTGAGSVTVLITGGMVATVLECMGIPKIRVAAIVFLVAGLSAAAPPVSLWAMLTAAGVNMPYVGFFLPLLVPCVGLAVVTIFLLGWKGKPADLEQALAGLPKPPAQMSWLRIALPFAVFFGLIFIGRQWPHSTPVVGLPLMFLCAATVSLLASPLRVDLWRTSRDTVEQLLPLMATLTCAGILVQIMTLTGARGLMAVTVVTLPAFVVFATLFLVLPVSEAVLMYGAAPVLGVPLVLLFNTMGLNPIVALAGMSLIWPLGDALPPTAIIGRLAVTTVGYEGAYGRFLKTCTLPAVIIMIVGTLMVVFSRKLAFLTGL